jgi:hypothetical protein
MIELASAARGCRTLCAGRFAPLQNIAGWQPTEIVELGWLQASLLPILPLMPMFCSRTKTAVSKLYRPAVSGLPSLSTFASSQASASPT